MWTLSTGVGAAADVYGHGRAAYDRAHQVAGPVLGAVDGAVNIGLGMAENTAHQGFGAVEQGLAGILPSAIDGGVRVVTGARDAVERPIDWATQRATSATRGVANAAHDAWSWMTD